MESRGIFGFLNEWQPCKSRLLFLKLSVIVTLLFILLPPTVYRDAGIDLSKPVIGMCNGGMSSCTLVLTAHVCGCPDVALYHVRLTDKL